MSKISGFAQQVKAFKHIKQMREETPATCTNSKQTRQQDHDEKLAFLKSIPKVQLEQLGFGDLDIEEKEDDFLSESSV